MLTMVKLGLGLLAVAAAFAWREHAIIRSSEIAIGEVSDFKTYTGSASDRSRVDPAAPLVTFTTRDGRVVVVEGVAAGDPGVARRDRVPVAYDEASPEDARILLFSYRFGLWFVVGSFGLLLIVLRIVYSVCRPLMASLYKVPTK